jgi:hypothetical protein
MQTQEALWVVKGQRTNVIGMSSVYRSLAVKPAW